jgi:hypothetical protein
MQRDLTMTPAGAKTHIAMTNGWSRFAGMEEIDELMCSCRGAFGCAE